MAKPLTKALISVTLCFVSVFLCLGYAVTTDTLSIAGRANAAPPEGIFITNISEVSTSGIDKNEFSYMPASTNIDNHIQRSEGDGAGTVIYENFVGLRLASASGSWCGQVP